jgi:hypothetical protein
MVEMTQSQQFQTLFVLGGVAHNEQSYVFAACRKLFLKSKNSIDRKRQNFEVKNSGGM